MPKEMALFICAIFIIGLFFRDQKLRPMASRALWVPLLWVMVIGSRGSNYWFSLDVDPDLASVSALEGSPVDRNIYLSLIVTGAVILWKRRLEWGKVFNNNLGLIAFILYCGVSIAWSDYPFVSFKGWIKDLGNVIMASIILTEKDPILSVKAVFARYIYFAVLFSAALIVYLPDLSSYWSPVDQQVMVCGVTTNKNEFGEILVICGLFLVRDLVERNRTVGSKSDKPDLVVRTALLVMVIWLLKVAASSTAVACLALGTLILIFMQFSPIKRQIRHLGMYGLVLVSLVLLMNIPGVVQAIVEVLGRDMTFTGRTEIWENLLSEPVNPVLGTGFHSFWIAPGTMERYGNINQAHNGYLETYLNGGLVGLFLLMVLIVSAGIKLKKELLADASFGIIFFSFFSVGVIYNMTEAMFNRLGLVWFVFLLASLDYSWSPEPVSEKKKTGKVVPLIPKGRVLPSQQTIGCQNGR